MDAQTPDTQSPKHRGRLLGLAVELGVVTIGVLLALAFDQLREDWQQSAMARASLHAIDEELARNEKSIRDKVDYHEEASTRAFAALDTLDAGEAFVDAAWYRGFEVPVVQEAAYLTALEIGVFARIDPPVSAIVTQAYLCQRVLDKIGDTYLVPLAETRRDQGQRFFNIIGFALSNLVSQDMQCLEDIAAARTRLALLLDD
ncbi:MAG: hypothetical protein ACFB6R_02535 [Alphaproteobacteria bacterium]